MARKPKYKAEELSEFYRRYAELKGWSTAKETIRDKVELWLDRRLGPVGLAIAFHEEAADGAKHLGYDAEKRAEGSPIQTCMVTLAGTEHPNADGSNRQQIAMSCTAYEGLRLKHEPDNRFDRNAIAVLRKNREQLGYLPKQIARETIERTKSGYKHAAAIEAIKDGRKIVMRIESGVITQPKQVAIVLFIVNPEISELEWKSYVQDWVSQARRL